MPLHRRCVLCLAFTVSIAKKAGMSPRRVHSHHPHQTRGRWSICIVKWLPNFPPKGVHRCDLQAQRLLWLFTTDVSRGHYHAWRLFSTFQRRA